MRSRLAALARDQALLARLGRIAVWVGGLALLSFVLDLLGIPVSDWISDLLKKIRDVPAWAVGRVCCRAPRRRWRPQPG
jgi:hypothetical protein